MEAHRPVLKACVPLQSDPERLDCVPDRATREIVGRRGRASCAVSREPDRLERVLKQRPGAT